MIEITQADREAVTAFHNIMAERIMAGDPTLGDNRDAIEIAFAKHRIQSTADLQAKLDKAVEALVAVTGHLNAMQNQCAQYLEPSGYTSFDRKRIAFSDDLEAKKNMFIHDMI